MIDTASVNFLAARTCIDGTSRTYHIGDLPKGTKIRIVLCRDQRESDLAGYRGLSAVSAIVNLTQTVIGAYRRSVDIVVAGGPLDYFFFENSYAEPLIRIRFQTDPCAIVGIHSNQPALSLLRNFAIFPLFFVALDNQFLPDAHRSLHMPSTQAIPISSTASMCSSKNGTAINVGHQRAAALWSGFDELCAVLKIRLPDVSPAEQLMFERVHLKAGRRAYFAGERFDRLYLVVSGFIKNILVDECGTEHVLGFPMKGDVIGIDGICNFHYASDAVALSDCELISMPFKSLTVLETEHSTIEGMILNALGQELTRKQRDIGMIKYFDADARVAHFLLAMADCFAATGYSRKQFVLRMTRRDIGNYLGLSFETISREMSAFHKLGLISVEKRRVTINDASALAAFRRPPLHKRASTNGVSVC